MVAVDETVVAAEAAIYIWSTKYVFLKISQNSQKALVSESLFSWSCGLEACSFI